MMVFCLIARHPSKCHHILWQTDADVFHADEAHLNWRNTEREREEPRVI